MNHQKFTYIITYYFSSAKSKPQSIYVTEFTVNMKMIINANTSCLFKFRSVTELCTSCHLLISIAHHRHVWVTNDYHMWYVSHQQGIRLHLQTNQCFCDSLSAFTLVFVQCRRSINVCIRRADAATTRSRRRIERQC